jgi:hypothetical protein
MNRLVDASGRDGVFPRANTSPARSTRTEECDEAAADPAICWLVIDLLELEQRVVDATCDIVVPLHLDKDLTEAKAERLLALGGEVREAFARSDVLPRRLIAHVFYIFTQMLTEADYARPGQRERLVRVAWEWWDRVQTGLEVNMRD